MIKDKQIRIGNDIRLKITLTPSDERHQFSTFDQSSIKEVRCYLINTSMKEDHKKFRRVGFPEYYHPTAYNINNSGFPSYHMEPANVCNYDRFVPDFHDFHWWPGFRGFGIHPEHFHGPHMRKECFGPNHEPEFNPWYLADSWALGEKNTLTCMFPARDQIMCGVYKLVVVITVYERGWGRHNLRTYTIDKGEVFELVDDGGKSGNVIINVDEEMDSRSLLPKITNIYLPGFVGECYHMVPSMNMEVGQSDINDKDYQIYIRLEDGTTLLYNPSDWKYANLTFTSERPDIVSIDENGTLHAHCATVKEGEDVQDITFNNQICITVSYQNTDETEAKAGHFCVVVDPTIPMYVGFDPEDSFNDIVVKDNPRLRKRNAISNIIEVNNDGCGGYLWIASQRKIQYIKAEGGIVSSSIRVPMVPGTKKKDGYFVYRSVAPITKGNMKIKIVYA